MNSAKNQVVITGMGILVPNRNSLDEFWYNTLNAVSGITEITRNSSSPLIALQDNLSTSVDQVERQLPLEALRTCGGVQTKAAELLGTTRRVLKYKRDKLNIQLPLNEDIDE